MIYGPEQAPTCGPHEDDGSIIPMRRVPAVANFKFGGAEGKRRTALQVRERNEAYHNSPKGQEEHRANVAAAHKRLGIS